MFAVLFSCFVRRRLGGCRFPLPGSDVAIQTPIPGLASQVWALAVEALAAALAVVLACSAAAVLVAVDAAAFSVWCWVFGWSVFRVRNRQTCGCSCLCSVNKCLCSTQCSG